MTNAQCSRLILAVNVWHHVFTVTFMLYRSQIHVMESSLCHIIAAPYYSYVILLLCHIIVLCHIIAMSHYCYVILLLCHIILYHNFFIPMSYYSALSKPIKTMQFLILFYTVLPLSVQDIFRRIFLSNCWWQKSDIWSQASYRYTILWVAFLDPSDSYFLFADFVDFYTHWTYMLIFRRIFLSNYWWQKSDIWSQASYRYPISWEAFLNPSDSYFLFADFVDFYTHWTYMHIFRRIFLSNCWWQESDISSQASYRYPILWEAFLDPSDSYLLFAEERGYHRWALAHSSSCFSSITRENNCTNFEGLIKSWFVINKEYIKSPLESR